VLNADTIPCYLRQSTNGRRAACPQDRQRTYLLRYSHALVSGTYIQSRTTVARNENNAFISPNNPKIRVKVDKRLDYIGAFSV
jgi:hypothetical protein